MILKNQLFKVLYSPHISEKSTIFSKKNNIITLKVSVKANKFQIKLAIQKLFLVYVKKINIVLVKGKKKKKGKYNIYRNNWKKAYITLKSGQNLDFMNNI